MERHDLERMAISGAVRSAKDVPLDMALVATPRRAWIRYGPWVMLTIAALLWEVLR